MIGRPGDPGVALDLEMSATADTDGPHVMTIAPWIERPGRVAVRRAGASTALFLLSLSTLGAAPDEPFARFTLPAAWQARFWAGRDATALLKLSPKELAALVPTQVGVRFCRCPACEADEADNPLAWSVEKPKQLTCRACGAVVPNDKYPAKDDKKKVPEDTVEVIPRVVHHYPYHAVDPTHQRYPDERLYLAAKIDYEAREYLAKAALYAALKHRDQAPGHTDPALARTACVILLRFAQVYPSYATHYDQPSSTKLFDKADLPPPYRRDYRTAKWDWSGSLDVPLNLVVAYALLRHDPAMTEAGKLLKVADPAQLIERDLFRASAEFVRKQPESYNEAALQADRGILAVGRLLADPELVRDALARLDRLAERGFYHDGFWRQGTLTAHRRVVGQLDGWIDRLLVGQRGPATPAAGTEVPMLALARVAGAAVLTDPPSPELWQASWPAPAVDTGRHGPVLLGGTGLARLTVGQAGNALDLELRSLDAFGPDRIVRQALRVGVAGRTVIDDLDERPGLASGFDHATVSHNTVVVDGLNQRESLAKAHEPAAGGNFLFFAADPDFQVVTVDDSRAYPQSVTRYRQTLVAAAGARSRYALGVFEIDGGRQHDQMVHGPVGSAARWQLSVAMGPAPASLLPAGLTFVPTARAGDGRWFIQSYGELTPLLQGAITRPATAWCVEPATRGGVGVRLHLLGDTPLLAVTATGPDPTAPLRRATGDPSGRAALLLRRHMLDGSNLKTTFVTVYEPVAAAIPPLRRVGRVGSVSGAVVVYVETADGPEQLVVNRTAGSPVNVALADGQTLSTDGLAVRVTARGLALAGGSFVELSGRRVSQQPAGGRIVRAARQAEPGTRGWFEIDHPLPEPATLAGRIVLVRHGDGTTRGWTLQRVENSSTGARLHVVEEPGFTLDPTTKVARYYQFPQAIAPGPHDLRIDRIARTAGLEDARKGPAQRAEPTVIPARSGVMP